MIKKLIAECEAEVVENGVPKVVTKRVQVTENETVVVMKEMRENNDDDNHDKTEFLDVENYEGNKLIDDENTLEAYDELEVKVEYLDIPEDEYSVKAEEEISGMNLDKIDEQVGLSRATLQSQVKLDHFHLY